MRPVRMALAVAALAVAATLAPARAAADKPSYGCAPGLNLGAYTLEQFVQLPRSQAAIDAGLIDEAGIIAGASFYDKNANGIVCVQLSHGFEVSSRPLGEYLDNVVDDSSSTP